MVISNKRIVVIETYLNSFFSINPKKKLKTGKDKVPTIEARDIILEKNNVKRKTPTASKDTLKSKKSVIGNKQVTAFPPLNWKKQG